MYGLACLAFAGPSRQTFELAGYQLELPARRPTGRSQQAEKGMAALQLVGILAALCAVVAKAAEIMLAASSLERRMLSLSALRRITVFGGSTVVDPTLGAPS
jgi:L-lactate utilization protein LutC